MPTRDHAPVGAPCWTDLFTSDVEGSRAFYCEFFGWHAEEPSAEFHGYFMFTRDGVPVAGGMGPMDDIAATDTWKVYLSTEDVAKTVELAEGQGARITVTSDVESAVRDADCVVTDTWVSMGDGDGERRHNLLKPYQVNARLMRNAKPDAIFLHCLPAHRGDEVTADVIDGPQSVVFDEAENRLHAQKGILVWCLNAGRP